MNRTDIAVWIHEGASELFLLHKLLMERYAPNCKWSFVSEVPTNDEIKYIVHTKPEYFLQARPREQVIEDVLEFLDHTPSIATVHLIPQASINEKGWFFCKYKGQCVWIERAGANSDDLTSLHLAWAREGQHANAILLGPWPVRLDAVVAGLIQEWVLDFAEAEGVSLRGPSLR